MPNFGSHLSGPIRHTTRFRDQSDRAWFRDLPVGMNDPDFVHEFFDFVNPLEVSTTSFLISSSGTGSSATVNQLAGTGGFSSSATVNGLLTLQTGSTAGNYITAQLRGAPYQLDRSGIAPNTHALQSQKNLWFEAQFTADVAQNDASCFIGLSEPAASVLTGVSNNYIGFKVTSGGSTINFVASSAGTATSGTTSVGSGNSVALVQGTPVKVGFVFTGGNTVDFYVNRNYMSSISVPAVPTNPITMTAQVQTTNSSANRTMSVDYLYACKVR